MRTCTSFFLVFGSVVLHAQSPSLSWGAEQTCGTSAEGNLRPRVMLNGANQPVVLWGRSSMPANFTAVGDGTGFSTPMMIHPMSVAPAVDYWMGSDLTSSGDTLWAVLKATPEDVARLYVVRSDDGGYTWGDTLAVDPSEAYESRFANIVAGPAGGPVVQYMRFDPGYANARIVTSRMVGGVFQPSVDASIPFAPGNVCDCCPGQAVSVGDRVVALYRNAGSDIRTMWASVSEDAAANYTTGADVDGTGWVLPACPSSGPDGYITGDSIRYVWMSGANNGSKVYLRSAHLPDLATGPLRLVDDQPQSVQQNYPRIAGSSDTLGVVWQQSASGSVEILFSWSVTGINGLGAPDTVNTSTTGPQKTPDIAYADGTFHLVWSDNYDDVVHYRAATINGDVAVAEEPTRNSLRAWPSPAQDRLYMTSSGDRPVRYLLTDATGRTVLESPGSASFMDVSSLHAGAYLLVAVDRYSGKLAATAIAVE